MRPWRTDSAGPVGASANRQGRLANLLRTVRWDRCPSRFFTPAAFGVDVVDERSAVAGKQKTHRLRWVIVKQQILATPSGFEPPISTLTGWHVRPLHHGASPTQSMLGTTPRRGNLAICLKGNVTEGEGDAS